MTNTACLSVELGKYCLQEQHVAEQHSDQTHPLLPDALSGVRYHAQDV